LRKKNLGFGISELRNQRNHWQSEWSDFCEVNFRSGNCI